MTTSLYFRNLEDLPAPLPTISEILASNDIIKGFETWATRKVVGVGEHFIAKYGQSNDQIEGENLLFLERNNFQGFAPRLYAMWKEAHGTLFLVMECLHGDTLESLWPTLQESDKDRILAKSRDILMQIRNIWHQGFFGSVNKSPMPHHLFYWPNYPNNISGPFTTERALIQGLILKSRLNARDNGRHSYLADFFKEQLTGSLVRKNILVEVKGSQNEKEFHISLVDWESAGWYPTYREYFAAFLWLKWDDNWCSKVAKVVGAWPAEAAMMKMI